MSEHVQTGLNRLLDGDAGVVISGRRVGLIGNPTSIDRNFRHAVDGLASQCQLVALFGPEHGIRGDAQYMVPVGEVAKDSSGLPVYSLYGATEESLSPTEESLAGVDVVVFDIQDVGSRYYTYVWTMVLAMRVCARLHIDFIVLDRPNPIGGARMEGGGIAEGYGSFVGLRSLPNRHGMTAGEIAQWACREEKLDLNLEVVEMRGWQRDMSWSDTGLPWVAPSPNMPTVDTALVYPGMCLLEGTQISEGRGTTRPFELSGAPYVDAAELMQLLDAEKLPGVQFRGCGFTPTFDKYTGVFCTGIQQHVTNPNTYLSYKTAVALVWAIHRLWPEEFAWRKEAYEFVSDIPAFDLLAGSDVVRLGIDAGMSLEDLAQSWRGEEEEFAQKRREWMLYS